VAQNVSADVSYKSLHSFGSGYDGQQPQAPLINVRGMLYGTTYAGGSSGDGAVFSIGTSGVEKVLYSFHGGNDGANSAAGLLATKGLLYGTTEFGGIPEYGGCNAGTVFSISTSGAERVIYRFYGYNCNDKIYNDGANPRASLIAAGGKFYGTTFNGGDENEGTVFRVDRHGREQVLHSVSVYTDGGNPAANLSKLNGVLYGTTTIGIGGGASAGTVFSITPSGTQNVLYNFPYGGAGGGFPAAGLIAIDGILYGTTAYGGSYGNYGTVFGMTPSGSLTILHDFGSGTDGSNPFAPLLNVNGKLYGTTKLGGAYGEGTIFKLSLTGAETIVHSFGQGSDGAMPLAGLTNVKGTLYGTTSAGGKHGEGTVFALNMETQPAI
jgi:uncharacterized repeat protein (TIGR03803 family)